MAFINHLQAAFSANSSAQNAMAMEKYMKNLFPFLGIKTAERRALLKAAIEAHKEEVRQNPRDIALQLYSLPQREYHYCAIEILVKDLKRKFAKGDIKLIEEMIITHSWWDSVDTISKYLLGVYLQQYPVETVNVTNAFSSSPNMWLNRAAILFQLGYKQKTDKKILFC